MADNSKQSRLAEGESTICRPVKCLRPVYSCCYMRKSALVLGPYLAIFKYPQKHADTICDLLTGPGVGDPKPVKSGRLV